MVSHRFWWGLNGLWWFLVVLGFFGWFSMVFGCGFCWFLAGFLWLMIVFGDFHCFFVGFGLFLGFVFIVVFGGFWVGFHGFWWCSTFFGVFW